MLPSRVLCDGDNRPKLLFGAWEEEQRGSGQILGEGQMQTRKRAEKP
jgi:hypothetical protein